MVQTINEHAKDVLFREPRSHNKWQDRSVSEAQLREFYDDEMGSTLCKLLSGKNRFCLQQGPSAWIAALYQASTMKPWTNCISPTGEPS
jgi:hypothetical protein